MTCRPARWFWMARSLYGIALLALPHRVLRLVGSNPNDATARVLRVLGARQIAQSLSTAGQPGSATLLLGAETDLAHAASMLALAAVDARHRRLGLIDAALALGSGAAGVAIARGIPTPPRGAAARTPATYGLRRRRDRLATAVADRTVPSAMRAWLSPQRAVPDATRAIDKPDPSGIGRPT